MRLTDHFTLYEMTRSRRYPELETVPTLHEASNLHLLAATVLEPGREFLQKFKSDELGEDILLLMESGLRGFSLNVAVGGHASSLHKKAKAGDVRPSSPGLLCPLYEFWRDEMPWAWSQLILYVEKGIIHIALPEYGGYEICEVRNG